MPASTQEGPDPKPQAFLFADLAGYTALTDVHGDQEAADLVADYASSLSALAERHGAHLVKTIGDAALVRAEDAAGAVHLALDIVTEVGARHGFPEVRVGLDYGTAVERDGDFFGAVVNTAARVTGLAGAGEVLLTQATHEAAGPAEGVCIESRGSHTLKGISSPVAIYGATREGSTPGRALPIDPVCHMAVDPAHRAGMLSHDGVTYHFCSLACVKRFAEQPERYVGGTDAGGGAISGQPAQDRG